MAVEGGISAALPEYEILGELGRGAMGVVLLARHRQLNRQVAIKQLPAAMAADPKVRQRFVDEAQTLAALNHPHVVVVHDFVDRQGQLALVMEQLPGGTVWSRFVSEGLTPAAATGLILSTAAGLHHAHSHGVLHRDVKPENLMLAGDGQLKVTDFGIAQMISGSQTLATGDGQIIGTPAYMAPEQAEGRTLGPPADVYACGTMLFEMITGHLPYQADSAIKMLSQRVEHDAPPLAPLAPHVPSAIATVVDRSLIRDPRNRYQSAEAMAVELGQAAADAWGPDWLNRTGVAVRGAEAIEQAARTTGRPQAQAGEAAAPQQIQAPPQTAPPQSQPGVPQPGVPQPGVPQPGIAQPAPTGLPQQQAAYANAHQSVIMPHQPVHEQGPDLNNVNPEELVNVQEIRKPPSPWLPLVLTLVLAALTGAAAFIGLGDPQDAETITRSGVSLNGVALENSPEADLSQPLQLVGLGNLAADGSEVFLEPSLFSIPLGRASGTVSQGQAEIDSGYLKWTTAGLVDTDVRVGEDSEPVATGRLATTHSWLPTAETVAAGLVGLLGLSLLPSNFAGFRRGRPRITSYIGSAIAGAILGLALAGFGIIAASVIPNSQTLIASGVAGALFGVAFGETYRRIRRWWLLRKQN